MIQYCIGIVILKNDGQNSEKEIGYARIDFIREYRRWS